MVCLAIISDIHLGPDCGTKRGTAAPTLLDRFVQWTGQTAVDLVIELGDRITDVDREQDFEEMRTVAGYFQSLRVPHHHLVGNHDVEQLTIAENEQLIGTSLASKSIDVDGFHLIFFAADTKLIHGQGFSLPESDLQWLAADLAQTRLPTVIFSHIPLVQGSMKGNFYFEKVYPNPGYTVEQGEQVREVIERSERVVLCVNGHTHWNTYHCVDGIHYVTIPSLTEVFPTYPLVSESWAKIVLQKHEIEISVAGNLPISYRLPVKRLEHHWLNVHKPYAPFVCEVK